MDFTGERYIPENSPADVAYEHWHRYFYAQQFVAGRDVLDIACGVGYGSALLAESAASVTGVDIDPATVAHAGSRHVRDNLRFLQGSVAAIPVDGKGVFDVVVSYETLEHVSEADQRAFLVETKRLLRPGGKLLISTPDALLYNERAPGYTNPFHLHEFDRSAFLAFLRTAFAHVRCVSQCPIWGSYIHVPGKDEGRMVSYGFAYGPDGVRPVRDAAENVYLIAVCSDNPIEELPFSVSIDQSKQHYKELLRDAALKAQASAATEAGLRQSLDAATSDAAALRRRVEEQAHEMARLEETVAAARQQIVEQGAVLEQQQTLARMLEARETTLAALRRQIDGILVAHTAAEATLAEQATRVAELGQQRAELAADRERANERVASLQAALSDVRGRLELRLQELADAQAALVRERDWRDKLDRELGQHAAQTQAEMGRICAEQSRLAEAVNHLTVRVSEERVLCEEQARGARQSERLRQEAEAELARTKQGISFRIGRAVTWLPRCIASAGSGLHLPAVVRIPLIVLRHPVKTVRSLSIRNIRRVAHHLSGRSPFDAASVVSNYLSGSGLHPTKAVEFAPTLPTRAQQARIVLPHAKHPKVSIIVPVYNQWAYTRSCLASVAETVGDIAVEVIVIDDGSSDETAKGIHDVANVRYLRNRANLGFLRSCKKAAAKAGGEYLLFLNNDTNPQPGWLAALVAVLEKDAGVGIVGPKLVYADGTLQEAGGITWRDASGWNYGKGDDPEKPEFNYAKDVDFVSGACLMIRRRLWERIGGFDERYAPAYYEDVDLCFGCRREQQRVVYQPTAVVVHHEGKTCGTDTGGGVKRFQMVNAAKFREKWAEVLERDHFPNPQTLDAPEAFVARDRSKDKPCLLVVDHHVPFYDQDAGSRSCLHYLRLMVEMGYNVKFIGDNFYRHEPYTTVLQQMGIEVLYGAAYQNGAWKTWLKKHGDHIVAAFVQRPHIAPPYIEALREVTRARVVYYGVDLHYLRVQRQAEVEGNPRLLDEAKRWREIEFELARQSDVSVFLSPVETEAVAAAVPGAVTQVIPMFVHDFFEHASVVYDPAQRTGLLCVGGFGHAPNVDALQWLLDEIMPRVWAEVPSAILHVVGSKMPDAIRSRGSERVTMHGALSDDDLAAQYAQCRVALVPLRYGAGMKGKVVEALEAGVPMVSTAIGLEGFTDLDPRITATDTAAAFAERIVRLCRDDTMAAELSAAQRRYIAGFFSRRRAEETFRALLKCDAGSGGAEG